MHQNQYQGEEPSIKCFYFKSVVDAAGIPKFCHIIVFYCPYLNIHWSSQLKQPWQFGNVGVVCVRESECSLESHTFQLTLFPYFHIQCVKEQWLSHLIAAYHISTPFPFFLYCASSPFRVLDLSSESWTSLSITPWPGIVFIGRTSSAFEDQQLPFSD